MVNELEMPFAFAGARIQRDNGRAEQIGADAVQSGMKAIPSLGSTVISPQLLLPPIYL
jgi:hypothetical protein